MLIVVGGVLLLGGGRRLLQLWQARKGLARLVEPDVTPEEIEAAALRPAEPGRAVSHPR